MPDPLWLTIAARVVARSSRSVRVKHEGKQPRLLGRGIPPSQPAPQHLAPASLTLQKRPQVPKILVGIAVGIGIAALIAAVALSWNTVFAAAPYKAMTHLEGFGVHIRDTKPLDLALRFGDSLRFQTEGVSIERVWIDSCRSGSGRTPPDECDRQPFFERALVKTILENGGCAPELPKDETISYTLEVNHRQKRTRLFAGRSGSLGGKPARSAVKCIEQFMPKPQWESLKHDHTRYVVGVLAAYPAEQRQ